MILNIFKPKGITSYKVVEKIKKIFNEKKVGHGGTLDPLAEGVLIVGVGKNSTKKLTEILKNTKKEYLAEIELGKISDTYDAEGKIKKIADLSQIKKIKKEKIEKALKEFQGEIYQEPPIFSAKKISGKPAYLLARQGKKPKLKKKKVKIYSIKLVEIKLPVIKIKIICSSGTYIRSIAYDLGKKLKVGGYLKNLARTRVGKFRIEEAIKIEELKNYLTKDLTERL